MNRSTPANRLSPLLLGLLLLAPALALADARIEARRHFRNGMSLIAAGSYDEGIAELKEAYAIKPHPNVLYNIARAYHDAGRVTEALDYYHRYLAANPADETAVKSTVARLEESLATNPPKPKPPPVEPPREAHKEPAPAPAVDAESVKRLNALMERLETAVSKAEALATPVPPPAMGGQAPTTPAVGGEAGADTQSTEEGTTGSVPYEEQVVTASRRAQSTLEAPNATTIITGEEIRMSGATTLVELLRRVPGAEVMVMGVGSANVSLRGFNERLANKVLVLLDGRTEYQDFLGLTIWSALPVGLEEIDRIEIIRGPGSALYGANAMLGVINIITRHPGSPPAGEFNLRAGSGSSAYGSFVASQRSGNLSYRASAAYDQADKYSLDIGPDRTDFRSNVADPYVGLRSARGNLTALYTFTPDIQVGASAGVNRFFTELYPLGLLRNFYLDGLSAYTKLDVTGGPVKLKLFWNHINGDGGAQYTAIGERPVLVNLSSDVFDAEALFGQKFELVGQHQLVVGAEARLKKLVWNFLDQPRSELHLAAYVQDEWRIVDPFRLVASYRVDKPPVLVSGTQPLYNHSPRISAVWIPAEGQALRAGFATAFREPTFLESYTVIRVPVPGVPGASAFTQGSLDLRPEQLTALELGYRGELPALGLEYDVALYQNQVRNLIQVGGVQRNLPSYLDAQSNSFLIGRSVFENDRDTVYTAHGAELGAKLSPLDGLDVRLSGALQQITATAKGAPVPQEQCGPCSEAPALKLFGGVSYRSPVHFDFSVDAAYVSSTTWLEREPNVGDPTIVDVNHYPLSDYVVLNARVGYRFLQDKATVAVVGTNLGSPHYEHPLGNRISQRIFVTLTVTP